LSRFPTFRGVIGIIPKREYSLTDYSGCLGSFGLLLQPGDFKFVGAPRLDVFLGTGTKLKQQELFDLAYGTERYFLHFLFPLYRAYFTLNLFGNYHYASNAFDFVHKYLRMSIGEPIFMRIGTCNSQARNFLFELLSAIKRKGERQHLEEATNFALEFLNYGYAIDQDQRDFRTDSEFDFDGGGLGFVHTMINLLD
jgi:hypothetical protein